MILFFTIYALPAATGEESEEKAKPKTEVKAETASDTVYYMQVRVVFAGKTGIYGNVPRELADMKSLLTQSFRYPSYELSNSIRLSLFGDEEATALVFPEHFLRVIPKGEGKDGDSLKAKVELYHVPPRQRDSRMRFNAGEPPNQIQYQEKEKEGQHSKIFPIAASAMVLTQKDWEAFGGIPVRVNTSGQVNSNTLSTMSLNTQPSAMGRQQFLILGIRLEKVRS